MSRKWGTRLDVVAHHLISGRLLLSSYAPLAIILGLRIDPLEPKLVCFVIAAWGIYDALRITWWSRRATTPRTIVGIDDRGGEVAGYLATYLLPMLAAPNPDTADLIAYGVFGLVIVVISLRSNLLAINPTVYVLGWRVMAVVTAEGDRHFLVCRRPPPLNVPVEVSTEHIGIWRLAK